MKKGFITLFIFTCVSVISAQTVKPFGPVPTKHQLQWHEMEFYLFVHFSPNTFTDKEWGLGDELAAIFNPAQLDCNQWCRIARAAGAKGIIITAKHHDGFCLWPSKFSKHTVRESKWKNGKGDVLKELSQACRKYSLKFGVYISPWDRNHPKYGTPEYNDVFVNMMKEIFQKYGPVWELWWDGANGEGPNGKRQVYDWPRFEKTVRINSPHTVVFSDIGPDIRWVGNENGIAGKTNWNLLDTSGFTRGVGAPPDDTLQQGNVNGKHWIPAECDVSIRPGWFYHENENEKLKTREELFDLYLKSVGRGANLLLNVPPDKRGLINEKDSAVLMGFKELREVAFKRNLVREGKAEFHYGHAIFDKQFFADGNPKTFENPVDFKNSSYWVKFNPVKKINCIILEEAIQYGQQAERFSIHLLQGASVVKEINGTTIGRKKIITFPVVEVSAIRIVIEDAKTTALLSEVAAYLIEENLIEK